MGEFTYLYMLHEEGLFRINVSDFGFCKKELKVECVYYEPSSRLCSSLFKDMGLFSNRHTLYMIGGDSAETGRYPDGTSFYSFNPTRFNEFPVRDPECVDEPDFYGDFGAMKCPHVVRANRMIYFFPKRIAPFYFRSFDSAENRFYTPPPPPFVLDNRVRVYEVSGAFVLRGYLYLFLEESSDDDGGSGVHRVFSFNTRLSKWREEEAMVLQFKEKDIPLPFDHRGSIALSNEFSDNTHVLVALSDRRPTAYRVCLHPKGSFSPKSYRYIHEAYVDHPPYGGRGQLFDLGSGKFCWAFYSVFEALAVCVFKIDLAYEHEIQISSMDEGRAEIISSKIFQYKDVPYLWDYEFDSFCLGSAPALHSYVLSVPSKEDQYPWSEHELTSSPSNEDQDRDAEIEKRNTISSCKRDGGGNDARGPEDMGAEEECEQIESSVGEKQVRSLSCLGSKQSEKKGKDICEASTKRDERLCCSGGNDARGPEDMGVEEECEQIEGCVGEKQARSLSRLGSRQSEEKGKAICVASTRQDKSQEDDPVALARRLASHFEMTGLVKTGDNKALSRWFIRSQLEAIMYGLAMIDRGDAASEQGITQEAENTAAEAKVKVLELQLEASNKANSAAQARLEALEQEKMKLSEKVEVQRKQLNAKDEELASTQDKAIQEWRQSEEFRQAAQSYARENMEAVLSRILSDKVAQNHIFKALFKTAFDEDEGQAPRPSAMEEVTSAPNCEVQDRDGQMEKRNKINSDKEETGGNNAKKRRCRSRD
ncbi:PREDICTED: uncharacterized protein LOC109165410 isoform X2 [Ipomoea nil]|uniref:uncharacterized protein LOC109165410 isoform X2 n=1 Tax=Ipomoea nil TaxID=35883 RepID=UPI000900FD88|nr:PREDICTED: uncharacterized protein LOC109165410 isoform X2 [Ipomoea nil]